MPLIEDSIKSLANRKSTIWLAMTSDKHQKSAVSGDEQAVAIITQDSRYREHQRRGRRPVSPP